ncbi:MAG: DUF3106 domain-containing protein [Betaproteobacteria bacterium]
MIRRALLVFLALGFAAAGALAQPPAPPAKPAAQPAKKALASRPTWAELTAEQQKILAPLRADWDTLDRDRRLKWVGIAKRYPKMTMQEQERVTRRMQAWAKLSPEQRRQARETYKQLAKTPPEKRERLRERWAEYQRQRPQPSPYPAQQ